MCKTEGSGRALDRAHPQCGPVRTVDFLLRLDRSLIDITIKVIINTFQDFARLLYRWQN